MGIAHSNDSIIILVIEGWTKKNKIKSVEEVFLLAMPCDSGLQYFIFQNNRDKINPIIGIKKYRPRYK